MTKERMIPPTSQDPGVTLPATPRTKTKAEGKLHDGPLVLIGFERVLSHNLSASLVSLIFRKGNEISLGGKLPLDPVLFARHVLEGSMILFVNEVPNVGRDVGVIHLREQIPVKSLWSGETGHVYLLSEIHAALSTHQEAIVIASFMNGITPQAKESPRLEVEKTNKLG